MTKYKVLLLFVVIIMILIFSGCSINTIEDSDAEMYSRTDTEFKCESTFFGKGRNDDIYIALNFIYSNKTIQEKHGSNFEIKANDITCHNSEGQSYGFYGMYTGQAEYSFDIDNITYTVKLSKKLFSSWTVTEFITK